MPDAIPPDQNVNWHTWISALVNYLVVILVGAIASYISSHAVPPVIQPPPVVNVVPAAPTAAPTELTPEQIQQAIDALKKKQK